MMPIAWAITCFWCVYRPQAACSLLFELISLGVFVYVSLGQGKGRKALDHEGEWRVVRIFVLSHRPDLISHALKLGDGLSLLEGETSPLLKLLLFDEGAYRSHLLVVVLSEVEAELFRASQLHQVVIEGLLRYVDFLSGLFQSELDHNAIFLIASVQEAPQAHSGDDVGDSALLYPALLAAHIDPVNCDFPPVL